MLTPEQLKPFFLHKNRWVRRAVAEYFHNSWSRDPDLAGLVFAVHERYFCKGELPLLNELSRFPLDGNGAETVLALLDSTSSRIAGCQLNRVVPALPLDCLRKARGRLEVHPKLNEDARAKIRLRLELAELSDDALWRELVDYSGLAKQRRPPHASDQGHVNALINELATRPAPGEEEICGLLQSPKYDDTWFEALVVKLAGAKRLKSAIPHLVRRIHGDLDSPPSYEVESLARIGDPLAVELIRERWPQLSSDARADAATVLGEIKAAESEEALLCFFDREEEFEVRRWIAVALCGLFSKNGIARIRRTIREGSTEDEWKVDLEQKLLPVLDILGVDLPEAHAWRKAREDYWVTHPISEEPNPEAEQIIEKIRTILRKRDAVEAEIQKAYEQLGESFADPDVAGESKAKEEA